MRQAVLQQEAQLEARSPPFKCELVEELSQDYSCPLQEIENYMRLEELDILL